MRICQLLAVCNEEVERNPNEPVLFSVRQREVMSPAPRITFPGDSASNPIGN